MPVHWAVTLRSNQNQIKKPFLSWTISFTTFSFIFRHFLFPERLSLNFQRMYSEFLQFPHQLWLSCIAITSCFDLFHLSYPIQIRCFLATLCKPKWIGKMQCSLLILMPLKCFVSHKMLHITNNGAVEQDLRFRIPAVVNFLNHSP